MVERSSPTLILVLLAVAVFVGQKLLGLVGVSHLRLALVWPVGAHPWALVTATFAHDNLAHLLGNLVPLLVAGLLIERRASAVRFYAFFLGVGAIAALAQVVVGTFLLGSRPIVLGASGAVFGLVGYLLTGNRLTTRIVGGITVSPRVQILVFVVIAAAVSVLTYSPNVALVAHFTGLLLGLVAGRVGLLRDTDPRPRTV